MSCILLEGEGHSDYGKRRWVMRRAIFLAAAMVVAAIGNVGAQAPTDPLAPRGDKVPDLFAPRGDKVTPKAATKGDPSFEHAAQRLKHELDRPTSIEFVQMPLQDVLLYLQETHAIPIVLLAKKLEEAGISPDHAVTKNLKGIRLRTALELMLDDLELAYVEKDGLLLITTPEDADSTLLIQVYNCQDLLAGRAGTAAKEGEGNFGGSASTSRAESLISLITTNVDSQSWTVTGGPGSISEYNGLIVVTQTAQTHRKVERTLDMLREAAGLEAPRVGKVVR